MDDIFVCRIKFNKARWLSWLERRPVTAEVEGSSPFRVVSVKKEQFYMKKGLTIDHNLYKII